MVLQLTAKAVNALIALAVNYSAIEQAFTVVF